MSKDKFDFKEIEEKYKKLWKRENIYKFDPKSKKLIYSIDTPPPNVSGRMHIGHACSYSQQDFIVRFMRMTGKNIFYPFGTDDNGLPTERFIEKTNNIKSRDMGRTDFINLCLKTLKKVTPECVQDFIDLGISADYDLYYSTIDKHSQKVSQKSFIELYKKSEIYSAKFPTIWCPFCQTSIAQAELEDKEQESLFSTLKFKCEEKDLLIATTRPELLEACVAVFVNPKDKRYKNIIGKKAKVPLSNFEVPILEDESAEINKGTGVLMICSYGDKFDVEAINRHNLNSNMILNTEGKIQRGRYSGLKTKEAREKILHDLKEKNLIQEQKKINHIVNTHDKCGNEIEFIETEQWFTKILNKKKELISQARKVNWYPKFMFKRYENWVRGLEWDWSISRNRHFGVPIPTWKCKKCNQIILPEEKELPIDPLQIEKICPKCKIKATPENRVLDTWATSSLTPQIASELPQSKNKVKIPFSLRPQGHDIIRTWAFYTIVKSYLHKKEIPWKEIIVSGNVSMGGEKMSKSKGNVVDPKEVIQTYGADALRFWAASAKLGNDLDYQEKDLVAGKKLINKLLNATRFVFMNFEEYNGKAQPKQRLELVDEIFLNKLNKLISSVTTSFEKYEYSKAKQEVEQFFWQLFCDNYLEIIKKRIYQNENLESKYSALFTLYNSLLVIIKLLAPIMPFITEEIYQEYFKKFEEEKSIHLSKWPEKISVEKRDSSKFDELINIISKIRQEKTKAQKAMNSECKVTLEEKDLKKLGELTENLKEVMNLKDIKKGKFNVEFI